MKCPTSTTTTMAAIAIFLVVAPPSLAQDDNINNSTNTTTTDAPTAAPTFACASLCGGNTNGGVVTNPDDVVTYDWNARVPVPSSTIGETVQTFTCAEFDVRLTTFEDDSDCAKHQSGLQAAGCQCGESGAAAAVPSLAMVSTVATLLVATLVVWL